ncbi:hypothetical protein ACVNF4_34870, partial [Streptomyces sp. S6]
MRGVGGDEGGAVVEGGAVDGEGEAEVGQGRGVRGVEGRAEAGGLGADQIPGAESAESPNPRHTPATRLIRANPDHPEVPADL